MAASQIYHVARCGSTLLSHILSYQNEVYNEPYWSCCEDCMPDTDNLSDKVIIKYSSISSTYNYNPLGNKVFLYRPLAQHLYKLKNIEQNWISDRIQFVEQILQEKKINDLINYHPKTDYEKYALFWALSVHTMKNKSNVLWIKTNDFLNNKVETTNKVCDHFNIPKIENFDITKYNVKKIRAELKKRIPHPHHEIQDNKVNLDNFFTFDLKEYGVSENHGGISTDIALQDVEIKNIVDIVKYHLPQYEEHIY